MHRVSKENEKDTKRSIATFYDRTFSSYHDQHYLRSGPYSPLKYRQYYIEKMLEECELPRNARVLDVGCGPGELVLWLTKQGIDAWGVDISAGMVEEATRTLRDGGFADFEKVRVGDIENLEFSDGSFDVVVCSGVIEYQQEDTKSLSEMSRVLKKGGFLILNVTNKNSYVTMSEQLYLWLKRQYVTKKVVDFAKGSVLGKGSASDFPFRRIHSPRRFDRTLADFGFRKIRHNYFRFSPLPVPFDSVFGSICEPMGKRMEQLTAGPFGFIGGGYLVLCSKER